MVGASGLSDELSQQIMGEYDTELTEVDEDTDSAAELKPRDQCKHDSTRALTAGLSPLAAAMVTNMWCEF